MTLLDGYILRDVNPALPPTAHVESPQARLGEASSTELNESIVYNEPFSGKLSVLMTHSANPLQFQPLPKSEEGDEPATVAGPPAVAREVGGRDGPEPTRFGDWELRGRCIDF